ncbi:MAG: hypothetical protein ACTSVE_07505, partial [Candidatus Helarchaeota archaeon]
PYLPLFSFLWRVYKELGWEGVDNYEAMGEESIFSFWETRLNESINTSKDVLSGKIQDPEKVLSYIIMLPSIPIRSDLSIGTQKLFGGESTDITFATVHDYDSELILVLNCHVEDGIPVDWYMIRQDDEILDRRHMKYGYKLREIPRRAKSMKKGAEMLQDVLRDIRNERTPEWSTSSYFSATVISSWAINMLCLPSNYECIGDMYDGWASKEKYGLPDYTFALLPFPSAFNLFLMQGRGEFIKKIASLTTEMKLYFSPWEPDNLRTLKEKTPHLINTYQKQVETEGIPFPVQSINVEFPNIKKDDPDIKFDRKYPKGQRIMLEDLEMTFDDFTKGAYINVDHETKPQKLDKSRIISKGIGRFTEFV